MNDLLGYSQVVTSYLDIARIGPDSASSQRAALVRSNDTPSACKLEERVRCSIWIVLDSLSIAGDTLKVDNSARSVSAYV